MARVSIERVGKLERARSGATQLYTVFRDGIAYSARVVGYEFRDNSSNPSNGLHIEFQLFLGLDWKFVHTIISPFAMLPSTIEGEPRWLEMEAIIPTIMATECVSDVMQEPKASKPKKDR